MHPGADPSTIAFNLRGAQSVRLNANGDLDLKVAGSTLTLQRPMIYQEIEGQKQEISGGYLLTADSRVKFEVGAYDRSQPLVIDPVLAYSTYLGGSSINSANGIAVDASGNAYITGRTISTNFPVTTGAYDTTCPGECASVFITKLNAAGNALAYSTYLGGTCLTFCGETGKAIAVDAWRTNVLNRRRAHFERDSRRRPETMRPRRHCSGEDGGEHDQFALTEIDRLRRLVD